MSGPTLNDAATVQGCCGILESGLPGTLSSSDDAADVLTGVVGLLDQIDLPFPGLNGGSDGSVKLGEGSVPLAGGLAEFAHGVVDSFAHQDRMTHPSGLVQLTATSRWPSVSGMSTSRTEQTGSTAYVLDNHCCRIYSADGASVLVWCLDASGLSTRFEPVSDHLS